MKRLACLLLVVLLVAAMTVPAWAVEYKPEMLDNLSISFSKAKVKMGSDRLASYPYCVVLCNGIIADPRYNFLFFNTPLVSVGSEFYLFSSPSVFHDGFFYDSLYVYNGFDVYLSGGKLKNNILGGTSEININSGYLIKDFSTAFFSQINIYSSTGQLILERDAPREWQINVLSPPLPDTGDLESDLEEAEDIEDIGYTPASWSRLQNALQAVRTLLAQSTYTQEEVAAAQAELQEAMGSLIVKPPPEESSEPDKPPPIVIGGYDVPDSMMNAVGSGDVMEIVTGFAGPFLDHAMSAFSVVVPLFGVYLAIKLGPKIFRFFVR